MTSVNTNVSASIASFAMRKANKSQMQTLMRLSSGQSINTAADDAAGLSVSTKLEKEMPMMHIVRCQ